MLENLLINCCSPTLASLKSGSLFNCIYQDQDAVEESICSWNSQFEDAGIRMCILRKTDHSALIYVYRKSSLMKTLSDPEVMEFLSGYGYEVRNCCENCSLKGSSDCSIDSCIRHLRERVALDECGFPHEIGIFLDYPLEDVKGFICNQGRNCKYTGIWKVYGDEACARKKFEKYKKCTKVYSELWRKGYRSVMQLTVAG